MPDGLCDGTESAKRRGKIETSIDTLNSLDKRDDDRSVTYLNMSLRTLVFSFGTTFVVLTSWAQPIDGSYIVRLKAGVDASQFAKNHGWAAKFVYSHVINGLAGDIPPGILKKIANDPNVEDISQDNMVYAIGKPGTGGPGANGTEVTPEGVHRIRADSTTFNGTGIGVAVVDTGLDFNHLDLKGNVGAASFNAFAFGSPGQDNNGHGTHVGGIIAAEKGNNRDILGVAPKATLYAVKVLNANGSGSDSDVIAGLDWVAANASVVAPNIRVVNMSLGRTASGNDSLFRNVIARLHNEKNIAVVVAAGNDPTLEAADQVPAGFPEVIAVASTTAKAGVTQAKRIKTVIGIDTASYFTSDGIGVTVSAPGEDQENINAAGFIESVGILSLKLGGGTTRMSGTSMASPHVAGIVALLCQKGGSSLTPEQIRTFLGSGASAINNAPYNSPTASYSFDNVREGVADALNSLTY